MITPNDFTRIDSDVNGNPRHVCHFMHLDVHGWQSNLSLSDRYKIALKLANTIGGKKYHTKAYGGGIVFQEYDGCLPDLCKRINELTNAPTVQTHQRDNMNPMIAYHAKSELRGWNEVCRHPADWEGWHEFDRSMIKDLLQHGQQVVTIGWNMYQVVE